MWKKLTTDHFYWWKAVTCSVISVSWSGHYQAYSQLASYYVYPWTFLANWSRMLNVLSLLKHLHQSWTVSSAYFTQGLGVASLSLTTKSAKGMEAEIVFQQNVQPHIPLCHHWKTDPQQKQELNPGLSLLRWTPLPLGQESNMTGRPTHESRSTTSRPSCRLV